MAEQTNYNSESMFWNKGNQFPAKNKDGSPIMTHRADGNDVQKVNIGLTLPNGQHSSYSVGEDKVREAKNGRHYVSLPKDAKISIYEGKDANGKNVYADHTIAEVQSYIKAREAEYKEKANTKEAEEPAQEAEEERE